MPQQVNEFIIVSNTTTRYEILYWQLNDTHKSVKFFFVSENIKTKENKYFQSNQMQAELYTINKG